MTRFHYDPDMVLPRVVLPVTLDPVRTVVAYITLPNGGIFTGVNTLPHLSLCRPGTPRPLVRALATHAERAAILNALTYHTHGDLVGSIMRVSLEPCAQCRELLKVCGVTDCWFQEYYIPSDARVQQ